MGLELIGAIDLMWWEGNGVMGGCSSPLKIRMGCSMLFRCLRSLWGMFSLKELLTSTQTILMLACTSATGVDSFTFAV